MPPLLNIIWQFPVWLSYPLLCIVCFVASAIAEVTEAWMEWFERGWPDSY